MSSNCNALVPSFNLSGSNPKFFKIILQDTILEERLAIPKKFIRDYGDCLSSCVILKVPDGRKWQLELSKGDIYNAWLEKGWKQFSCHYSLQHSHLLLFEYQHESNFLVFIFDTTLTEIQYVRNPNSNSYLEQNPSQLNDVIQIEDSDSDNLRFQDEALEAADKFSSRKPWFKVVLKSTKKGNKLLHIQSVPVRFVRDHMDGLSHTLCLKVEGSNYKWPTTLNVYWRKSYAHFSSGWRKFLSDNCLKIGDVCIFELVATKTLKVHIFRHSPSNG